MAARRSGYHLPAALALAAMITLVSPGAWSQAGPGANVKSITITLTSSGARKECVTLATRQRLRYWYRAEGAVNFAIQYVDD